MNEQLSACSIKLCVHCAQTFAEITTGVTIVLAALPNVMMQDTHGRPAVHIGDNTSMPFPRCKRNGHGWSFRNYAPTDHPVTCKRCLRASQ